MNRDGVTTTMTTTTTTTMRAAPPGPPPYVQQQQQQQQQQQRRHHHQHHLAQRIETFREYVLALLTPTHLHSTQFYVTTGLIYLLVLGILFTTSVIHRLDEGVFAAIVSSQVIGNLILACGVVLASCIAIGQWSHRVPLEFGLFAGALWISYSNLTADQACLCCTTSLHWIQKHGVDGGGSDRHHASSGAPSVLDAVNHRLEGSWLCNNPQILYAIVNVILILLLAAFYAIIVVERDFVRLKRLIDRRLLTRYLLLQNNSVSTTTAVLAGMDNTSLPLALAPAAAATVATPTWTTPSNMTPTQWCRFFLVVLFISGAFLPLQCNNYAQQSLSWALGRSVVFLCLLTLRLVNSHMTRVNLIEISRHYKAMTSMPDFVGVVQEWDNRLTGGGGGSLDTYAALTIYEPTKPIFSDIPFDAETTVPLAYEGEQHADSDGLAEAPSESPSGDGGGGSSSSSSRKKSSEERHRYRHRVYTHAGFIANTSAGANAVAAATARTTAATTNPAALLETDSLLLGGISASLTNVVSSRQISAEARARETQLVLEGRWLLDTIADVVVASSSFVLCHYYTPILILQFIFETVLLLLNTSYRAQHLKVMTRIFRMLVTTVV
jgi:hypothetical protein